uniref:Uncharacterized protein n=1 Tax=Meloidogyne floridensis TaxID=298350 RepID=A0A915ND68_9BILA
MGNSFSNTNEEPTTTSVQSSSSASSANQNLTTSSLASSSSSSSASPSSSSVINCNESATANKTFLFPIKFANKDEEEKFENLPFKDQLLFRQKIAMANKSKMPHPLMNVLPNNQSYLNNINIYPTNVVPDTPSMYSSNKIEALNRQKKRQISIMEQEILKKLDRNLKEGDEKQIETFSILLASKRNLVINSVLDVSENAIGILNKEVQDAEKKHNQKVKINENRKNALVIGAKKEIGYKTKIIDDLFKDRFAKEKDALLVFNKEIERTVKDMVEEVCWLDDDWLDDLDDWQDEDDSPKTKKAKTQ